MMKFDLASLIDKKTFKELVKKIPVSEGGFLLCVDANGNTLHSTSAIKRNEEGQIVFSLNEALRWGEPNIMMTHDDKAIISVPVMMNKILVGGIVCCGCPFFDDNDSESFNGKILNEIGDSILKALDEMNLTNSVLLKNNRALMLSSRLKGEALQSQKTINVKSVREIYLYRESMLLSAMKRGDKNESRGILNEILLHIYSLCARDIKMIKVHIVEIVIMMMRTAIQMGAKKESAFQSNYKLLSKLPSINDEETLSIWVTDQLESAMDSIIANTSSPDDRRLRNAIDYIEKNLGKESLGREEVAAYLKVSGGYLSRLLKAKTGESFSDTLAKKRIEKSCEMLANTDMRISEIAYTNGFSDQSYFTKVFKKYAKMSPIEYRRKKS